MTTSIDADPRFRPAASLVRALGGEPVRVGTENQAKLSAVRDALAVFARDETLGVVSTREADSAPLPLEVVPVGVASDVPEQPIGWSEIVAGARNRARAALASGPCALAVGIEDGLVRLADGEAAAGDGPLDDWFNVGCAFLTDGERESHGFSSGFAYPTVPLERALRDRAPIGDLFDAHWRTARPAHEAATNGPSGRQGGNIGRLTGERLARAAYGGQALVCALVRFLHGDLYD